MAANAVYSLRRAVSGYSGNIVRLRRDSDDAEADFGLSNGELNTSGITSWLGGATGYVATWYDQSGNGNDLIQATDAAQPSLNVASEPYLNFDGTDDKLTTSGNVSQSSYMIAATYDEGASFSGFPGLIGPSAGSVAAGVLGANSGTSLTTAHTGALTWINGVKTLATGGSLSSARVWCGVNADVNDPLTQPLQIGQERTTAGRFWGGKIYEAMAWGIQLTNDERLDAEEDIVSRLTFITLADKKRIFIFAGQSNMLGADALIAGTGTQNLLDAGLQLTPDTQALFSCASTSSGTDIYGIGDIRGHEDAASSGVYVHGPEVGFVRKAAEIGETVSDIVIIKFAANFSSLESGRSPWVKGGSLYTALAAEITQRLAELDALSLRYAFSGFCWHQGIDDGIRSRTQAQYEADLTQIITDLRADYGNDRFVLARSVNSAIATPAKMAPIRAGQVAVANADDTVYWIDTDDLTPYVDTHHLTSDNQIIQGNRMAESMFGVAVPEGRVAVTLKVPFARRVEKDGLSSVTSGDGVSGTVAGSLPTRLQRVEQRV